MKITREDWIDWFKHEFRVDRESYTPLFKKAVRFCYDNIEDNEDFCFDNVWNVRNYHEFIALGEERHD